MNAQHLTQTLVESFNALADEVQHLNDRQVVLEHKLRYAHEQFQYLADRYAPAAPEISDTLVNLQIPPDPHNTSLANTNYVPLLKRKSADSTKHQIALIIREGRRAASSLGNHSRSSRSSRDTLSRTTMTTAASTVLEQDFTVEGKKGTLGCPFTRPVSGADEPATSGSRAEAPDTTPHHSGDPICAAMYEENTSMPAPPGQDASSKCPIRYMDQHSPEEIAHYLEVHKHELPRSHEVCLRRYQKNEDHIRKLDAKYGNLVNMVEGLGRIHQPMLPEQDTRPQSDVERGSNERVETWAQTVNAIGTDDPDRTAMEEVPSDDDERQSHFDRPLKEVRVGESPSRPWGISVPIYDTPSADGQEQERPESPPPAPVPMPSTPAPNTGTPGRQAGKCPFDHTKLQAKGTTPTMPKHDEKTPERPAAYPSHQPYTPATEARQGQPTFFNADDLAQPKAGNPPQMLFTGPVFIGYPIEQAIQFMQHFQGQQ
ncbi:hypothetical protein JX265_008628 [Neoarthrinium moseri]|uniref:Uncharacterized protein n=1 Tax=Neoarthrinium moseri TaxID=1658444 RepID=A0A9Q0ANE8_9PEZI|nr:hypothetical protein JX265_008628 [Neoarthrinium moseri]